MSSNPPRGKPKTLREKLAALQLKARKLMAVSSPKVTRQVITAPFLVEEEYTSYRFTKDLMRCIEIWCCGLILLIVSILNFFYTQEYPLSGAYGLIASTLNVERAPSTAAEALLPSFLRSAIPVQQQEVKVQPRQSIMDGINKISVDLVLLFVSILSAVSLIKACIRLLMRAQEDLQRKLAMEASEQEQDPTTRQKLAEEKKKKWEDFDRENEERAKEGRPPKRMRVVVRRIFTEKHLTNFIVVVICIWMVLLVLPLHMLPPKPTRAYGILSVVMTFLSGMVIAGLWGTGAADKFYGWLLNLLILMLLFFIWRVVS